MPKELAALLIISFIIGLFYLEFKEESPFSFAIWIPTLFFMTVISKPLSQWFTLGPVDMVMSSSEQMEGDPINRLFLILLMLIGLAILIKRNINLLEYVYRNKWVFVFFAYVLISFIWSDYPLIALKRIFRAFGIVIMVLVILSEPDPMDALKKVFRRTIYLMIPLSVLFVKYYRDIGVYYDPWGGMPNFRGVSTDKNSLGRLCLICGMYLTWDFSVLWRKRKKYFNIKKILINIFLFLLTIYVLKTSNSVTSLIGLIFGICVYFGLRFSFVRKNIGWTSLLVFIYLALVLIFEANSFILDSVALTGKSSTFLSRTILWKDLIGFNTNPIIGTGYGSFWLGERLVFLWNKYWWQPTQAHNGYLEIYLELGLIGVTIWIGILFTSYKYAQRILDINFDFGRLIMAFIFIMLVYNVTEANFQLTSIFWFTFLLLTFRAPNFNDDLSLKNRIIYSS